MALHHICNPYMRVTVNDLGAQLWSILGADGTQYLWQGDPAYWSDRALTIFPYVARLWQGLYVRDGSLHRMPIHGFASSSRFILREITDTRMICELTDNEDTRECYPRRFSFRVVYALEGRQLSVTYEVENLNPKPMYFGLGGHPGFNVPLEEGKGFEDYRLRFGAACTPSRIGFSDDCFVNGEERPFPLDDERILPLRHDLFDEDAIVLRDSAREVTLESMDGTIDLRPQGLCIRVSSLSPFEIRWKEIEVPESLPQTGDNTSLPMYALALLLSLAAICYLNRKKINA